MPVVGITGGIATGKSTFTASLRRHLPADVFDADQCARELLDGDESVRSLVAEAFGPEIFDKHGNPDRVKLRGMAFADPGLRQRLEASLHPEIRARWFALAADIRRDGGWFLVDIPLLFETAAESYFDCVVVVACSAATQRRRLSEQRGLHGDMAGQILAAQLDLATKITKADYLIWNDSTVTCLDQQAGLLAGCLRKASG